MPSDSTFKPRCLNGQIAFTRTRTASLAGWAGALHDHRSQPRTQRVRVERALDLTVGDERDGAGLFRHDDGHRVVLLGEADGRAMPRAELLAQPRVDGQRQKAGRRGDRSPCTMTAPSWSGDSGWKMLSSRS